MLISARFSALLCLLSCANEFEKLAPIAGRWAGSIATSEGLVIPASATITVEEGVLSGQMDLTEPDGLVYTYVLRRSEVIARVPHLSWTDLADPARGLVLDGDVLDGEYTGQATLRYACEIGTCGWTGQMTLLTEARPTPLRPTCRTGVAHVSD